jgi:enoyl-CoA hydratase
MIEEEELLVSRVGRLGCIRLNRPKALNSLTLDMVRRFTRALEEFAADPEIAAVLATGEGERGLCAGGDIRTLYRMRDGDKSYYRTFWREEYQLNALIASFGKPYVVLMDGLVMGGGVGVSAHGDCRVVTERTRLAMPETAIGFIPDVGGTWLLSRAKGPGVYMALSGATVTGADALSLGLADVWIDSRRFPELVERLCAIDVAADVAAILGSLHHSPGPGQLEQYRRELDEAADVGDVEEMLQRLDASGSPFLRSAATEIRKNSPTSLKVTHALLQRASRESCLEACLVNEYRAACRLLEGHDLYEGIRAAIIDKDRSPKWSPATLEEVSQTAVAEILAGDGSPEPAFPGSG